MTLFKQISILVTLAFLGLFILVEVGNIKQSGQFLRGQLQTTAQDTATVLGISISTTGSSEDKAALDTLFNAVFDSGYYSGIRLVTMDGVIVHEKQRKLEIQNVPNWFIDAVPLSSAIGTADVISGWIPFGKIELMLHPGFAYASLYNNLTTSLIWFSLLFLIVLSLLWFMLHVLLKPLREINRQANAIHENKFIQQTSLPKTLELRRVVEAMNRLIAKVQNVFEDQENTLSRYQSLLYKDRLSNLGNRNYMMSKLEFVLHESNSFSGSMVIMKIQSLDQLRERKGYADADDAVKFLAELMGKHSEGASDEYHARMSDDEFSMLLPSEVKSAEHVVNRIFERFILKFGPTAGEATLSLVAGLTEVHSGREISEILAELDLALTHSLMEGPYSSHKNVPTHLMLPQGKMQWRSWLQQMLDENKFYLVEQAVIDMQQKIIQHEVFIRANDANNNAIPAGVFIPMALALGRGIDIDRQVFKLLRSCADKMTDSAPLALNLSAAFFSHADAFVEFKQLLDYFKQGSNKLCIETTHATFLQSPDMCLLVAEMVKQAGQRFGFDQFDLNGSMKVLQEIRPDYIKVSAKVLDEISGEAVSAAYQALRTLTHTLDIQLIAVGVDDQALYERLQQLNIDAAQGNLLSQTREVM
jgi:EAL domain-containing protein (putative c-di-GMP-specific phosphodiesterase class I)/GGDEF domain-containing protein